MKIKNILWFIAIFLAICVSVYPILYFITDMSQGILATKTKELLANKFWNIAFYTHISLGGVALLIGWTQFNKARRIRRLNLHRNIGKIYVITVLISALAGLFVAFYASGGVIAKFGFSALAILWFTTTLLAFTSVKKKEIAKHQKWMIRSYALCFAAVTLRLWIPILTAVLSMEFIEAYRIIAWLCWVPNLLVAEYIIRKNSATLN